MTLGLVLLIAYFIPVVYATVLYTDKKDDWLTVIFVFSISILTWPLLLVMRKGL